MAIELTNAELDTLTLMRTRAVGGQIGYWEIYDWLGDALEAKGVSSTDQTLLWLRGATEANANRGAMSALIRGYTESQYQLRYGTVPGNAQIQTASDAVATNLIKDLLGENADWPRGQVPDIARIALADATAIGELLFNVSGDTAAPPANSAWSGALLFSLLRSDQTGRLTGSGAPGALDTLNDLRDVLFAAVSYAKALPMANTAYWNGTAQQIAADSAVMGPTLVSYFNSGHTVANTWDTVMAGASGGVVGNAFARIAEVRPNVFLDMIMGAVQGKSLIGTTTTDAGFQVNANAFFGALTPAQLQALQVMLLPTDAASLASLATSDVNVRAALGALSVVSVQVTAGVAEQFSLYDPGTGLGLITQRWINDRAAMTDWLVVRSRAGTTGPITGGMAGRTIIEAVNYEQRGEAGAPPTQILVGAVDQMTQRLQVIFGGDAADTINGYGRADRLYGGAGADILSGQGGNDYLEGNAGDDILNGGEGADILVGGSGNDVLDGGAGMDQLQGGVGTDTYSFAADWGSDLIQDNDGLGSVQIDGLGTIDGTGAKKVATNVWQTADKKVNYTLVTIGANQSDLIVTFSDRPDVVRIQGWSVEKNVGIRLEAVVTSPPPNPVLTSDFIKQNNDGLYTVINGDYVSAGAQVDAPDVINGSTEAETLQGQGGNDGIYGSDGADRLDGGSGNDLLLGGRGADILNGGEGNDVIFGSAVGGIDTPTAVSFSLPSTTGFEVFAQGFSWVATRALLQPQDVGNLLLFRPIELTGAIASPGWTEAGQTLVEADGNVIDGGAGDDYIAAGTGNDIVQGGEGDDDIIGMDGADLLAGNAGDDHMFGDGTQRNDPILFTPLNRHGNDTMLGGAGNDVMIGQGGDDELYGEDGNDKLWTDDPSATETPSSYNGNDYADGGAGDDEVVGGGKNDTLFGGTGNDTLWGDGGRAGEVALDAQGKDYLDGEEGMDLLIGGGNDDVMFGGAGSDTMLGDDVQSALAVSVHGNDYMDGEAGDDVMVGGGADDEMYGGDGNDQLQGDDLNANVEVSAHGKDYLDGGAGDDTLIGGGSGDALFGGDGNDFLRGDDTDASVAASAHGNDYLDGGAGNDTVLGDGGNDSLMGGEGNDWIRGDDEASALAVSFHGNDFLEGGAGDDTLLGDGGSDTLIGGAGADYLAGGAGDDVYNFEVGDAIVDAQGRTDTIVDTQGKNTINLGGASLDTLYVQPGAGLDLYVKYSDSDVLVVSGALGNSAFNYVVDGEAFSTNRLLGALSTTPVALTLANGGERVFGGYSDDTVTVTAANSVISGGLGDDTLIGSGGNNTYQYEYGDGADTIRDTSAKFDAQGQVLRNRIAFGEGIQLSDLRLSVAGGQLQIQVGADAQDAITLDGFSPADPDASGPIDEFTFADGTVVAYDEFMGLQSGGTGDNDVLSGTEESDLLRAGAGDDLVSGGAGDDMLLGGDGNDQLYGDEGDDTLVGGAGFDYLVGGDGADRLVSDGDDYLEGGAGNDTYDLSGWREQPAGVIIDDSEGNNRVLLGEVPAQYQIYVEDGMARLAAEGREIAAFSAATDLGAIVLETGSGTTSLLDLTDTSGRLHSMQWVDGTLVSTSTIADDQNLHGSQAADAVDGGIGDDALYGWAGDDLLSGGEGNDIIVGGQGADVIVGGRGNDLLSGADSIADDQSADIYQFDVGDGADSIDPPRWGSVGAARDIIRFGEGIAPASLQFVLGGTEAGNGSADLVITYGDGDSITLLQGAFAQIDEIRFADGSSLGRDEIVHQMVIQAANSLEPVFRDRSGSGANEVLIGGSRADQLTGGDGDDTLIGGAGNDVLTGGAGSNTYVFSANSGADTIMLAEEWQSEAGVLRFEDAALSDLHVSIDGSDILVQQASGSFVRVHGLAEKSLEDWQVVDRDGQQASVDSLITWEDLPPGASLADDRDAFLARQRMQLLSMPQRWYQAGEPFAVPVSVAQVTLHVDSSGQLQHEHYLTTNDTVVTTTTYVRTEIDEPFTVTTPPSPARIVKLQDMIPAGQSGIQVPQGAVPVLNAQGDWIGYLLPADPGHTIQGQRVVGYETTAIVTETVIPNDQATQAIVTGSEADDTILAGTWENGLPALFRGSISTGGGNDSVLLANGGNLPDDRAWDRFDEWQGVQTADLNFSPASTYVRGLGAWIDLGAGDDTVTGTDGDDYIRGGSGSDYMDGQSGSDTYYVSFQPGEVDHISDLAYKIFEWPGGEIPARLAPASRDTVVFDESLSGASLSYRWTRSSDVQVGPETAVAETLQLYANGQHFLSIDYLAGQDEDVGRAGVEFVRFADGPVLTMDEFVDSLPLVPSTPPVVVSSIDPVTAGANGIAYVRTAEHFADPENDFLTFSAQLEDGSELPWFVDLDPNTGILTVQPYDDHVGSYAIRITANDGQNDVNTVFQLTVAENGSPVIEGNVPQVLQPQHPLDAARQWQLPIGAFADHDEGSTLTFSLHSGYNNLPSWLHLDSATGVVSGTPSPGLDKVLWLNLRATDNYGAFVEEQIALRVADWIEQGTSADDSLYGTWAASLLFGEDGNDYLLASAGDDVLNGGAGDDSLVGGAGIDSYVFSGHFGADVVDDASSDVDHLFFQGWSSTDFLGWTNTAGGLFLRSSDSADSVQVSGLNGFVFHFDDVVLAGAELLDAMGRPQSATEGDDAYFTTGDTVVDTLGGNDLIRASTGTHVLRGGAGEDDISSTGVALIEGGEGDDMLGGENASLFIIGGTGADTVISREEASGNGRIVAVNSGDGRDTIDMQHADGNFGVLSVGGVSWTDISLAADLSTGSLTVHYGPDDSVTYEHWFDPFSLYAVTGQQLILQVIDNGSPLAFDLAAVAQEYLYSLTLGGYRDLYEALSANEILLDRGMAYGGKLAITYAKTGSTQGLLPEDSQALLTAPGFGLQPQRFRDADLFEGTESADILEGTDGADRLFGYGGDDYILGFGGADTIDGGAGNDQLAGAEGADTYLFGASFGRDSVEEFGEDVNDAFFTGWNSTDFAISGDAYTLMLRSRESGDWLAFDNWFDGGNGFVLHFDDGVTWDAADVESRIEAPLVTESDDLVLSQETITIDALGGNDELSLNGAFNIADGNEGDDAIHGGAGVNVFRGGVGNDSLISGDGGGALEGEDGDDYLEVGTHAHFLAGGTGADSINLYSNWWAPAGHVVAFNVGDGQDTVSGHWQQGQYGVLSLGGGADLSDLALSYDAATGAITIQLGASDSITYVEAWNSGQTVQSLLLQIVGADSVRLFDLAAAIQQVLPDLLLTGAPSISLSDPLVTNEQALAPGYAYGGELAMEYALGDGTRGLLPADLRALLASPQFGLQPQPVGEPAVLEGTEDEDFLEGTYKADQILGHGGDDSILGYEGADTIDGGAGNDYLAGAEGADTYLFGASFGRDWVQEFGEDVNDVFFNGWNSTDFAISGDAYTLLLRSRESGDWLAFDSWFDGGNGFVLHFDDGVTWDAADVESRIEAPLVTEGDDLVLSRDSVTVDALGGNDELSLIGTLNIADGNEGDDVIHGGAGINIFRGGAGNDTVVSWDGKGVLEGEDGDDYLEGSASPMFLAGGAGADSINLFANGSDPYVRHVVAFNAGDGQDTVNGYAQGGEYGVLSLGGGAGLSGLALSYDATVGSVTIHVGASDSITYVEVWNPEQPVQSLLLQIVAADSIRLFDLAAAIQQVLPDLALTEAPSVSLSAALLANEQTLASGHAYGGDLAVEYALGGGSTRSLSHEEILNVLSSPEFAATAPIAYDTVNRVEGTPYDESLAGTSSSDRIHGGAGADTLAGGAGDDTYLLRRGDGADTIQEDDGTAGNHDVASFATGIGADQLWFRQSEADLEVSILGTADKLVIADWYDGAQHYVEQFRTADGKQLLDTQVQSLVDAMASFTPPAMGQTTLPPNYASSLQPVIAASWQ